MIFRYLVSIQVDHNSFTKAVWGNSVTGGTKVEHLDGELAHTIFNVYKLVNVPRCMLAGHAGQQLHIVYR